jgi:type IV pilus assembly protein PilV
MRRQQGLTLIDVLVAVVLFSIGVLGLVALQARSSQSSVDAESRIYAAVLADDIVGVFIAANTGTVPSGTPLNNWQSRVSSALPGGVGTVSGSGSAMSVSITWCPTSGNGYAASGSSGSSSGSSSSTASCSGGMSQYKTQISWP